jgi:tetratricopeptide (TPR) repeat protein
MTTRTLHRGNARLLLVAIGVQVLVSCAARLPVVTSPAYPSYPYPEVPPLLAGTEAAANHERGWLYLQAGDLDEAERTFAAVVESNPGFHPTDAGLGFVALSRGKVDDAVARFDLALGKEPTYVPALLGRGEALLIEGRVDEAVLSFLAALAADPGRSSLRQRIEELRFAGLMKQVALARAASADGRDTEARTAFERVIADSPDSGFLYVELAEIERRQGATQAALGRLEQAVALDPDGVSAWMLMADIYTAEGDLDLAEQALLRADAIEPNEEIARALEGLEARRRDARLPSEYHEIEAAEVITRGQLAALIGVRFERLLMDAGVERTVIITDARDHWGYRWVIVVAQAGIMEADTNYRFQPERQVTRAELADVAVRLLDVQPGERQTDGQRLSFSDLAPGNLRYTAASNAVAAGVMELLKQNTFQPGREVSGVEAIAALGRVGALVKGGG